MRGPDDRSDRRTLSSGAASGAAALFNGVEVLDEGAVGVRLDGVELLPCVSQGASPIGPELTITAAEGHVIGELAGKPALEKLRETIRRVVQTRCKRTRRHRPGRASTTGVCEPRNLKSTGLCSTQPDGPG